MPAAGLTFDKLVWPTCIVHNPSWHTCMPPAVMGSCEQAQVYRSELHIQSYNDLVGENYLITGWLVSSQVLGGR